MTAEQAELLRILRHHCQGMGGCRTIESLVSVLGARGFTVVRRDVERWLHEFCLAGYPVGTGCVGATKGVFWIRTVGDWEIAYRNIEMRFRPLAQRRAALLDLRQRKLRPLRMTDGTGDVEIEVGRDGRIERMEADAGGQGVLFTTAGQKA